MNKVLLIGRITKEPELKYTPSGKAALQFTIAVTRSFKDAEGNRQADFINCVAWRNNAEYIAKYIHKGYLISVEGMLQVRKYNDQQNQAKYVTEVIVESISNLTPKEVGESNKKIVEVQDDNLPF